MWVEMIRATLKRLGFEVLFEGAKKVELVFTDGRLRDTGGLAFLGRNILVQTYAHDSSDFGTRLKRIVDAVISYDETPPYRRLHRAPPESARRYVQSMEYSTSWISRIIRCIQANHHSGH
ncbi:hypothetical protein L596_003553 [Steinernema carpocapsae]|uniref:Uncharacterized protein n=1 Tax=Steinernema carpocapsae TaxID=34508 RepID=A0A4U8UU02_STECR|nr:hypothetical protein L596_003553 [Steinernema carpocapsae]